MPDSDWRSYIEVGRVIVVAAIVAVTLAVLVTIPPLHGSPKGKNDQSGTQQEAKDKNWRPHFSVADPYSPHHNANCRNPKDREEADLCQQWRVAEATEKAVALADSLWAWNVVQVIMAIAATLATAYAAWAASRAASAARDAVEVSAMTERPVVFLLRIDALNVKQNSLEGVSLHFENAGRLPATFNVISFWGREVALVSEGFFQDITETDAFVLRSGDKVEVTAIDWDIPSIAHRSGWPIFVRGAFRYDSQLGVRKWTYFCFSGAPNGDPRRAERHPVIWREHGGANLNYEHEEYEPRTKR